MKMLKALQGWMRQRAAQQEQKAVDSRNAERRRLCAEYPRAEPTRKGAIIARIVELNGEADIKGAIERIGYELDGIDRRTEHGEALRQVEMMRVALNPAFEHDHFTADMKHFRKEYCGGVTAKPAYVAGCQFSAEPGVVRKDAA